MAKLIASRTSKVNGDKIIAGYRIALPKVEMEKNGFREGDDLKVEIKKGEVRIKKA